MKRLIVNLELIKALPVTQKFLDDLQQCAGDKPQRIAVVDMDSDCFKAFWDTYAEDRTMPEPPNNPVLPTAFMQSRTASGQMSPPKAIASLQNSAVSTALTPQVDSPSSALPAVNGNTAASAKKPCNCKGRSLNR